MFPWHGSPPPGPVLAELGEPPPPPPPPSPPELEPEPEAELVDDASGPSTSLHAGIDAPSATRTNTEAMTNPNRTLLTSRTG